ncbi:hypothetical protein LTS18_001033, partial [Coniosporium uncinatum]
NGGEEDVVPLQYSFEGRDGEVASTKTVFQPKLRFAVDEFTGQPVDASLAPETKNYLHQLALSQKFSDVRITEVKQDSIPQPQPLASSERRGSRPITMIDIPLRSDSEFFNVLQNELSGLAALQKDEEQKLNREVNSLTTIVAKTTDPASKSKKSLHDLALWRQIFDLYINTNIFFSATERYHGANTFDDALARYHKFSGTLKNTPPLTRFKRAESAAALDQFLRLNVSLLQSLKFQQINTTAMHKILKKFDKRTALGVQPTFPALLSPTLTSASVAKSVSASLQSTLLATIPRLDDYSCLLCTLLAWRPIRLRCGHLFCIRCLIELQRRSEDRCPLCRENVVLEADSFSIDRETVAYLMRWFPAEVKERQRENERAVARD